MGPLKAELGTDEPYTLNYGGAAGRPPMLYVPVPLSLVRTALRRIERGDIIPQAYGAEPPAGRPLKLTHVGEAHATISMDRDLGELLGPDPHGRLKSLGFFDGMGRGMRVQVRHTGQFKWMRAGFYKDAADPEGPILAAEKVVIPQLEEIRVAIGLTPVPQIPGQREYVPHITVGYLPNLNLIHRSYVGQKGANPRYR